MKKAFVHLLALSVLFPYFNLFGGGTSVRLEMIYIGLTWAWLILGYFSIGRPVSLLKCTLNKWFAFIGITILISLAYGSIFKGQLIIGRDYIEIVKVLQYFLTFALIAKIRISPKRFRRYYKISLYIFVAAATIGIMQYFNIGGINEYVSIIYAPTQMEGLLSSGRITGTMGNPNEFGALMVLAAALSISGGMSLQKGGLRILCWVLFPLFISVLILTASRSALFALVVTTISIIFIYLTKRSFIKKKWRIIIFVLFTFILVIVIIQYFPEKTLWRFLQFKSFGQDSSWQARMSIWDENIAIWKQSIFFGWGPAKANMSTVVDNEWLYFLRRYGIFGLIIFLSYFSSMFMGLSTVGKNNNDDSVVSLSIALRATLIGYGVYMIPAAVYHALQLMPILLLFIGLSYSQLRQRRIVLHKVLAP